MTWFTSSVFLLFSYLVMELHYKPFDIQIHHPLKPWLAFSIYRIGKCMENYSSTTYLVSNANTVESPMKEATCLDTAYCFKNNSILFYLLFSFEFSVSPSYELVSCTPDSILLDFRTQLLNPFKWLCSTPSFCNHSETK